MKIKNAIAVCGGVILLIFIGVVLMQWIRGGSSWGQAHGVPPVSTVRTDVQRFTAVTNSEAPTSIPEEASTVVKIVGFQPVIQPEESPSGNQINIAGQNYPILLEGQSVSAELKQAIIDDLALNMLHFQRIDFMELPSEEEPAAQMYQQKISHWLDNGKQPRYFPDAVEKYFGGAVKVGDTFQLIIHEKLTEEYRQALVLKKERKEMFEKLDEFVQMLSNKEAIRSLAQGNVNSIRSLMYFHGCPEPTSEEEYRRDIQSWDLWVRPPSLLDVKPLENIVEKGGEGAGVYTFSTLISNVERDPVYLMKKSMGVFIGGEWRILVTPSP